MFLSLGIAFLASLMLVVGNIYLANKGEFKYFDLLLALLSIVIYIFAIRTNWAVTVCGTILLGLYVSAWLSVLAEWRFGVPATFLASVLALATTIAGAIVDGRPH
jgi:hypothetical protein